MDLNDNEKIKLFKDVFSPKTGEKVLFLIDIPHDNIADNHIWKDRRSMADDWFNTFVDMGKKEKFLVDKIEYKATGVHNSPIPSEILDISKKYNLLLAMTEFSGSSSFLKLRNKKNLNIRCASMPTIEKRMENTAIKADYEKVKIYADNISKLLTKAIGAEVIFSTQDYLYIDLRNRIGFADGGDCTKSGQFINFPSGEGCIAPYEAVDDEIKEFGKSKTEGILPDNQHKNLLKYKVKNNKIVEVIGEGKDFEKMKKFFDENETHRNIAELGIGCNPKAVVTGNILEDEKVSGLHIAYGMSTQLGGKVESDMHQDICFPKGSEAAAKSLKLINEDGTKIELIKDSKLKYDLINK